MKKKEQLGMNPSTAAGRLRKNVLFSLVQRCGEDLCHQCGNKIETPEELSIEHKTPWLDSEDPVRLFFDLDNISFSHLSCNAAAARKNHVSREHYLERRKREGKKYYTKESRRERYLRTGN